MADSGGIPELNYNHPEGRLKTRFEMDQWLRQEIPKVHWLRIIANRVFGLPKQISWDMKEIVLKHWLLDEMVRRQYVVGDQLGVSTTSFNDEAELRQFTQRLAYFVQAGFAVSPQHAEGVDMNSFTPPPGPSFGAPAPNGQPTAYPPGPPMPPGPPGPPQGYAQPPQPPGPPAGPPGGYAQPPMPPGPPPGPPQQYAQPPQQPPQQQYAPPPQQQQYAPPPSAPPMAGPPMGPPPGVPQGPPAAAAPARRGRKPADQAGAPQQQQGQPPPGPPGAPPGFAPAPFPGQPQVNSAPPPGFAPLPPQPQNGAPQQTSFALPPPQAQQAAPTAASVDLTGLNQKLDQLLGLVSQQASKLATLEYSNRVLGCIVTVLARGTYQRQGSQDPVAFLQELGLPLPPQ